MNTISYSLARGRFDVKLGRRQEGQLEFDVASSLWLPKGDRAPARGAGAQPRRARQRVRPLAPQPDSRCDAAWQRRDSVIYEGDALSVLRTLPSETAQCIVTSPPYWGLRDYRIPNQIGLEPTLPEFLVSLRAVFSEARRVLRNEGVLWLNIGDGYTSGNRGWRAPDKKNRARAMAVRPDTPLGLKPKDLLGIPWRLAFTLQDDGWYLRADIIWNKPNAMPESVKDRPTRAHEYLFMFTKSDQYLYDRNAIIDPNGRNKRSIWDVNTLPYAGAHFATFPPKLIEPCIKASTRPGDIVLDPFFGSGTSGLVAKDLGRRYVGIELHPEYIDLARKRLGLTDGSIAKATA